MSAPESDKRFIQSARKITYDAPKRLYIIVSSAITPPLLVFFLILIVTVGTFWFSLNSLQNARMDKSQKNVAENQVKFTNDMQTYAQILWGGVGRINSGPLDRAAWEQFIGAYNIEKNYPGVQGVGVIQVVSSQDTATYTAQKSIEYGRTISLFPANNLPSHAALAYFEPESPSSLAAIGFDIYENIPRREGMQKAAASGQPTITTTSGSTANAENSRDHADETFFMYVPYYDQSQPLRTSDQRKAAIRGFIVASFEADDLFSYIFRDNDFSNTSISVSIPSNKQPVYVSDSKKLTGETTSTKQAINIYQQTFNVEYRFANSALVSNFQTNIPFVILFSGIICAGLLSLGVYYVMRSRYHRLSYEKERDVKLAKDDLLSLASHQLRTPATGVKQYVGMVLQGFAGPISKQQKKFLEKAYASNDRQLHIINDILYLAKLDAGRMVMAKTHFDLAAMVRDIIEEHKDQAKKASLTLTVKTPKKVMCTADAHMLRMVVENLISNALKYTPAEGTVHARLRSTKTGLEFTVSDTGVGIDPKEFKNLFQQFHRIPNERSHLVSGTGVGLYLARHFVALHGGSISIDSQLGQGATFTVLLPK